MEPVWTHEASAAYAACALDTDGWIGITITKREEPQAFALSLGVSNQNRDFLLRVAGICGVPPNIGASTPAGRDSRGVVTKKQCYQAYWRSPLHVVKVLSIALPFIVIKRQQAELVLEYAASRITENGHPKRGRNFPYTDRQREIAHEVWALNHPDSPVHA